MLTRISLLCLLHRAAALGLPFYGSPAPGCARGGRALALESAVEAAAAVVRGAPAAVRSVPLERFLQCFRGDFDNLAQVESERAAGVAPREGGGHEHIHCRLQPVDLSQGPAGGSTRHVLASYYFDGQPDRVFRARLYELRAVADDADFGACIQMGIYYLRGETQQQLADAGHSARDVGWSELDAAPSLRIPGCDVFWRWCGERFEGRMRTESIVLESPVLGKPIVVRDDVALSENALWCNDRGNGLDGSYIYGNIRGVPYKMDRVSWSRREPPPAVRDPAGAGPRTSP